MPASRARQTPLVHRGWRAGVSGSMLIAIGAGAISAAAVRCATARRTAPPLNAGLSIENVFDQVLAAALVTTAEPSPASVPAALSRNVTSAMAAPSVVAVALTGKTRGTKVLAAGRSIAAAAVALPASGVPASAAPEFPASLAPEFPASPTPLFPASPPAVDEAERRQSPSALQDSPVLQSASLSQTPFSFGMQARAAMHSTMNERGQSTEPHTLAMVQACSTSASRVQPFRCLQIPNSSDGARIRASA